MPSTRAGPLARTHAQNQVGDQTAEAAEVAEWLDGWERSSCSPFVIMQSPGLRPGGAPILPGKVCMITNEGMAPLLGGGPVPAASQGVRGVRPVVRANLHSC
ncbi:hypothetical protein Kisp02_14440 [Kineosporia sp. NBRC 101731]|nr:hypothetical protein Kisp02_14440 [Kineosporia sp. NBRC 101731]